LVDARPAKGPTERSGTGGSRPTSRLHGMELSPWADENALGAESGLGEKRVRAREYLGSSPTGFHL
jgi:hypothetical protein